ncbi:hypothetical protein DL96DRAFT_1521515 [Flagelloscypha sp. PMI_526]|nr:hypothetical protein DL96DRAFT_1521515 [Flagelloscypha sp. PMI_526]
MSSSKLTGHPSLPAPVVHIGFTVPQSKSHVLAGVQDAYWSDDEADEAECPLCLEEMDVSDLNFKPCICGYQICRFCWHHIKENLNGLCPACRRKYTDEVEFTAVKPEDHKKLTQQKKQRERERKELETLGRRQLANVRVVQRNVVYVVGIGPRFAKEELIPTLRSQEYFGKYGKISKILLTKRKSQDGGSPIVGLYITYSRREDAARAIQAVDNAPSPGGGKDLMSASYGTTKYCMTFLRGQTCTDHNCMNLHEWGDEKDCFTKEDLTTIKHTLKANEGRLNRSNHDNDGLPRSAAWASKNANFPPISSAVASSSRVNNRRNGRTQTGRTVSSQTPERPSKTRTTTKPAPTSRSPTPSLQSARPPTPAETPTKSKHKKAASSVAKSAIPPPQSPAPSVADSEPASVGPEHTGPSVDGPPPGLPPVPPGLSPPPGLTPPPGLAMPPRVDSASPQTPLFQPNYQMSNAARGLLDDLTSRRQNTETPFQLPASPFPDLDHTLDVLSGDSAGGFGFSLDPNLAVSEDDLPPLPNVDPQTLGEGDMPFNGTFFDAFPALKGSNSSPFMSSPGVPYTHSPSRSIYDPTAIRASPSRSLERQSTGGSNYAGAFNPFGDPSEPSHSSSSSSQVEDDRKVSRFGFARGRRGSNMNSPNHTPSPLGHASSEQATTASVSSQLTGSSAGGAPNHWRQQQSVRPEYLGYAGTGTTSIPSNVSSPHAPHSLASTHPSAQPSRFQPFDNPSHTQFSEAQLRELLHSGQAPGMNRLPAAPTAGYPFNDPAIMTASYTQSPPSHMANYHHPVDPQLSYGPPPGLPGSAAYPPGLAGMESNNGDFMDIQANPLTSNISNSIPEEPDRPALSASDFPALSSTTEPSPPLPSGSISEIGSPSLASASPAVGETATAPLSSAASAKAECKAARKAAAAEKAAERARIAEEKAAIRAAEKARIAAEKEAAKEHEKAVKLAKEQAAKEKAQKDRIEKERIEKERLAKIAKDKQLQEEREVKEAEKAKERERQAAIKKARQNAVAEAKAAADPTHNPPEAQSAPILSRQSKKKRPVTKPIKVHREDSTAPASGGGSQPDESFAIASATTSDPPTLPETNQSSSNNSRAQSLERDGPVSLHDLFEEISALNPYMDLSSHPFFDLTKINPEADMPVEYAPLVHALSALSVGGSNGSTGTTTIPTGSMDSAVTNFQQLLETLTNTISDLLHLLPRTTWDDNSSFNGSLQDMMRGEESLDADDDDDFDVHAAVNREDDVAALTLALERRARWMEVQLSKLEELHRDINTAAVRAVLSFNDHGWDRRGFLPHGRDALKRFDDIPFGKGGVALGSNELEKRLKMAKDATAVAEMELREVMERMHGMKPVEVEF